MTDAHRIRARREHDLALAGAPALERSSILNSERDELGDRGLARLELSASGSQVRDELGDLFPGWRARAPAPSHHRDVRASPALLGLLLCIGCGARTQAAIDSNDARAPEVDAGTDAGPLVEPDARAPEVDAGTDAGPPVEDEVCNGRDDDLDGRIDEDIPEIACGIGACQRFAPGCVEGRVPACTPGEPSREVCNGDDDDCDARIDEGLPFGQVGEPIVIGPANDGRGPCPTCPVADVALGDTPDGMLAMWTLLFDWPGPVRPEPATFVRALDRDGRPTSDLRLLGIESTASLDLLPARDGRLLLASCSRLAGALVTRFVGPRGELFDDPTQRFEGACSWAPAALAPAGYFFSGATSLGWSYEIADARAVSLRIGASPHPVRSFASIGDRSAMVYATRSDLELVRLDPTGAPLGPPARFGHPRLHGRSMVVESDGSRWLVIAHDPSGDGDGASRTWLSSDGRVLEGPERFEMGNRFHGVLIARYGDGFLCWGYLSRPAVPAPDYTGIFVWKLDAEGRITHRIDIIDSGPRWPPALVVRGSRAFLLYVVGSLEANRVELRELGCASPPAP